MRISSTSMIQHATSALEVGEGIDVFNDSLLYGLRVFLWCIGLLDYIGHPQPPDRSQHGCFVGVNRDPPVWPSIQAG